ncbi:MAG: hypothetical protein V4587_13065 [Acidobacteriota bacterium]
MVSAKILRELISEYLKASIELPQFSARFAVIFYDIEKTGDAEAIQISYRIETQLAKQSEGVISAQVLRSSLASLIEAETSQQAQITSIEQYPTPLSPTASNNSEAEYCQCDPIQVLPELITA